MSSNAFAAYILDFTVASGSPRVNFITQAPLPTTSTLSSTVQDLISYINTSGINLSNYSIINSTVTSIITQVKATLTNNATLTTLYNNLSASVSDSSALTGYLNTLLATIQTSTSSTSTFVPPEEDTGTANGATTTGAVRNKRPTSTVTTTHFKGLGNKVAGIQADSISNSTTNNSFITIIKGGFHELFDTGIKNNTTRNTSLITTGVNGTIQANPNFINNIARSFFNGTGNRRFNRNINNGRRHQNPDTTTNGDYFKQIHNFSTTNTTTSNIINTSTIVTSDSYEIYTSVSTNSSGMSVLQVTFAYFTAGASTSTFSCNYNLTPASLFSLSNSAFTAVKKLNIAEQNKLVSQAGISISSIPNTQDLWNAYLVFMLSFVSFGVAAYLKFDNDIPYSGSVTGSANYMLNQQYLNNVSNISLPISLSGMESQKSDIFSTGIAGRWSDLMYSDSTDSKSSKTSYGSSKTIADAITSLMAKQTSTS